MLSLKKTYFFLYLLTLGGYAWVGVHLLPESDLSKFSSVCLFKNTTDFPCPSCGTTTSLLLLLKGQWMEAVMINPLGYLSAVLLAGIPTLLFFDLLSGKPFAYALFIKVENILKHKRGVSLPLILILMLNWTWNIIKSL